MARMMKDSGIEWIGEIPETWQLLRMKSCIEQRDSGAWGDEATGEEGDTICLRIADFDYARFRFKDTALEDLTIRHYDLDIVRRLLLQENDILIEKSGGGEKTPVGRTVLFDKTYPALYANFMDRLRCASFVYPPFMQYLFVTFYKNDYTRNYIKQTTGIQNLDLTSMLSNEKVAMPLLPEQQRIAAFLDRKCAEIDVVIEKTKATIEEYKKLKHSVITEAVTKGIRGNRPMKDSGIEWIGEIPEEWEIRKCKHISSFINGYAFDSADLCMDFTYPVIRIGDIKDGCVDFECCQGVKWNQGLDNYRIQVNDILLAMSGATVGKVGLAIPTCNSYINQRVGILRSDCYKYLYYVLSTDDFVEYILLEANGSAQPNVSGKVCGNYPLPYPPCSERKEIVLFLDEKCAALDILIAKKTALLTELETYKKSLIYEYVTGKKEVPYVEETY